MKILLLTALASLSSFANAAVFDESHRLLFGIRAGGEIDSVSDYERAEKAVFHGIAVLEAKMQKAIEEEVHSLFDDTDHVQKEKVSDHVKSAVTKGATKVKSTAKEHSNHSKGRLSSLPFLPKHAEDVEHDDHKILHAIEAAEKAVLHAVQEEVNLLFHGADTDHPLQDEHPKAVKKAKASVKEGVEKVKKESKDSHEERKRWMENMDSKAIDEYFLSSHTYGMF